MPFADWWAQRTETQEQNLIAEDIFICSQITRETLCQTTSLCRDTLWQYWKLKILFWLFQDLSMLRNIYSSTAIHADDQLKTWEQLFHISLQHYVKNRCSQALVLKQYLSLYLYKNDPIYNFFHFHTKSMYFHNNWHYIKHLQGYKSILVFECSSISFISSPHPLLFFNWMGTESNRRLLLHIRGRGKMLGFQQNTMG